MCMYFLLLELLLDLKGWGKIDVLVYVVVMDVSLYVLWVYLNIDCYYVVMVLVVCELVWKGFLED